MGAAGDPSAPHVCLLSYGLDSHIDCLDCLMTSTVLSTVLSAPNPTADCLVDCLVKPQSRQQEGDEREKQGRKKKKKLGDTLCDEKHVSIACQYADAMMTHC